MRHRKSGRHLNRTSSHRKAMFANMAASLFEHEIIKTTVPKAKELRRVAEPLITLAKEDSVANRRLAFSRIRNKAVVGKLFSELGPRYQERPGGYTRILKAGYRHGDAAPVAYIELVGREMEDFDDFDDFETAVADDDVEDAETVDEAELEDAEIEDAEVIEEAEAIAESEASAAEADDASAEDAPAGDASGSDSAESDAHGNDEQKT